MCSGVELHITDRLALEPLALGLHLVKSVRDLACDDFRWRAEPYEFVSDIPALDLLTGSSRARRALEGDGTLEQVLGDWKESAADFAGSLDGILLYHS